MRSTIARFDPWLAPVVAALVIAARSSRFGESLSLALYASAAVLGALPIAVSAARTLRERAVSIGVFEALALALLLIGGEWKLTAYVALALAAGRIVGRLARFHPALSGGAESRPPLTDRSVGFGSAFVAWYSAAAIVLVLCLYALTLDPALAFSCAAIAASNGASDSFRSAYRAAKGSRTDKRAWWLSVPHLSAWTAFVLIGLALAVLGRIGPVGAAIYGIVAGLFPFPCAASALAESEAGRNS